MKITVVGAGAVGGYFGGRWADAGADVCFLVREKRAEQLKQQGLEIESPFGNVKVEPKVVTHPDQIEACDLILLAVKNYHLQSTIELIRPLIEKGAKLLPLLNGVEHFQQLQDAFGKEAVLGGLCHIISTLDEQGHILHSNQLHNITFGALHPSQTEFCREVLAASEQANFRMILSEQIHSDLWNKYLFITAFSGVTTASRLPIDEILQVEATKQVFIDTLKEMLTLAEANQAPQPEQLVEKVMAQVAKMPTGSTASMHQDFRKGLPIEVESLQGAAVRIAERSGVDVPTVRTLYGLIKPYEKLQ